PERIVIAAAPDDRLGVADRVVRETLVPGEWNIVRRVEVPGEECERWRLDAFPHDRVDGVSDIAVGPEGRREGVPNRELASPILNRHRHVCGVVGYQAGVREQLPLGGADPDGQRLDDVPLRADDAVQLERDYP